MMFTVPRELLPDGILAGLAIVLATAYAVRRAPAYGLDAHVIHRAFVIAALGGLIGGHALYVAAHGGYWLHFWQEQSVFGVLAGAALTGALYLRWRGEDLLKHADVATGGVALGYCVARIGCFWNGDDFGALTSLPIGVHYVEGTLAWHTHLARGWIDAGTATSLAVLPVQLLLAAAGLAIFVVVSRVTWRAGAACGVAAMTYAAARFVIEPMRDDFLPAAGPLSISQLFCVLLFAFGCALTLHAYAPRLLALRTAVRA